MGITDAEYTVRYINTRMKERFGPVEGRKCHRALAGRENPCPVCPVRSILHGGEGSFRHVARDLRGRIYDSSATPILLADGGKAVIQILNDITDRSRAQEVIREHIEGLKSLVTEKTAEIGQSELLSRLLLDRANDAILIADPAEDRILSANRMAEAMTGYTAAELLAMKHRDLYAAGGFERLVAPLYGDGGDGVQSARVEIIAKGGRRVLADASASAAVFRGKKVVSVICRDISQYLIIDKNMRQLAGVIENMSSSVIIMDLNRRIVYVNPATQRMLGYRAEEMLGRRTAEIFDGVPGNQPDLSGLIMREARNGMWEGEFLNRRKSGEIFPVLLRMCAIRDERGVVSGYAGIAEDISGRKQLEEALIQKEKLSALGELISGIAHELNNPLTGVLGYIEIIQQYDCPAEMREDVQRLCKEAIRCQHLVKNLLTFSRRPAIHKAPEKINSVVMLSIELRAHHLRQEGIAVRTALDDSIPATMLDSAQMQQVFVNILNNAQHALALRSGERAITVSSSMRGGSIAVSIANNGEHIPPDRLEKIFTPFFSTKAFGQGTGLGMCIAQRIVKEHGGEIRVQSMEGSETVFTVEIPFVRPLGAGVHANFLSACLPPAFSRTQS